MELTRRDFFKATGAAVATTAIVVATYSPLAAAFPECPRQIAFRMKDKLTRDWQEVGKNFPADNIFDRNRKHTSWRSTPLGKQWLEDLDVFMDHLTHNIPGPNKTFEETRDEVRMIIKGQLHDGTKLNIDIMTCTEAAFVVCLVKDCIANHRLPAVYSKNWRPFAKKFCSVVMSV